MKSSSSVPRDCAGLAPQLTALFDGEADDAQMRAARAHLLICPSCSRLWLDWTQHRDILQSEPLPALPPTLLWRVLIAYRVAAFARPARRHTRLPMVGATPLRGLEAPLPPRLSQHILARTTRQPSAHVMLTPMHSASPARTARWKSRTFAPSRASLWAAPALALWLLMLSRADFTANLPMNTPDAAVALAPTNPSAEASAPSFVMASATPETRVFAPIPLASSPQLRLAHAAPIEAQIAPRTGAPARSAAQITSRPKLANPQARAQTLPSAIAPASPATRAESRAESRAERGLGQAILLAMSAGRRDIEGAVAAPRVVLASTPVARATPAQSASPGAAPMTVASQPAPAERRTTASSRATRPAASEEVSTSRVTLAALASPTSPIRTISAARLRLATFSEDSLRPRVAQPSAGGRRLARAIPDQGAIPFRVSRPVAGAPTLREVRFNGADNGPRLDELRSAVDDFRASVASNDNG